MGSEAFGNECGRDAAALGLGAVGKGDGGTAGECAGTATGVLIVAITWGMAVGLAGADAGSAMEIGEDAGTEIVIGAETAATGSGWTAPPFQTHAAEASPTNNTPVTPTTHTGLRRTRSGSPAAGTSDGVANKGPGSVGMVA